MRWEVFQESAPEIASVGFELLNRKIAYLATIKRDGSPRLHPVTSFIGDGMLFIFTEPTSPKIGDLLGDKRYALHCSISNEGPLIEFLVMGTAEVITDHDIRNRAFKIAKSPVVTANYVLFEYLVESVLLVGYDENGQPIPRRWKIPETTSEAISPTSRT